MMERFLPQTIAKANWKLRQKKTTFNDPVATHDCIQHVCPRIRFPRWIAPFVTGPSLLLECFNSSGAAGLTTTQILPNRKASVEAKAAAKEMARFWKSTEGMAVKNYLEMKVPWKHVIQVCFWERKFIVDLNVMKWDFLIVESAHVDQYLTNSLDGIWNVWFSDFWLQLLGRSILKRQTLTTCLLSLVLKGLSQDGSGWQGSFSFSSNR